jgi:hypothetical protein
MNLGWTGEALLISQQEAAVKARDDYPAAPAWSSETLATGREPSRPPM